ncbi:MAG: ATP-dependent zinc protease [Aureliella sp.]
MNAEPSKLPTIGWREYVSLPDLKIPAIKVKVDTGARSSSLHAFEMELYRKDGLDYVRFKIHPVQRNDKLVVEVETPVFDLRRVRSSSGESSVRPVIVTVVELLGVAWPIELTLANRDQMGFRMLLGREAMRGRMLVDPGNSYFGGKPRRKKAKRKP